MPEAVERVEGESESSEGLEADLYGDGPGGDGGNERLRLEVPAGEGGDSVGGEEGVHATRDDAAGDTVQSGGVPGNLRAVDGKVWRDGAVQALLLQNVVALGGGDVLGRDGPGETGRDWLALSCQEGLSGHEEVGNKRRGIGDGYGHGWWYLDCIRIPAGAAMARGPAARRRDAWKAR